MRDELYVSLKNLGREDLCDGELVILLALNGLIVGNLKENCINYSTLCYSIYGRKVKQAERETIKKHLNRLASKKIITLVQVLDSSTSIYNVEKIFVNVQHSDNEKKVNIIYVYQKTNFIK